MELVFCTFSFLAIVFTFLTIIQENAVYSLLYLIVSILSISGIFFSLGAFFAGALEVIIYAGAIIVLFTFVIMMLNLGNKHDIEEKKSLKISFWIIPSILSCILLFLMTYVTCFLIESPIDYFLIDSKSVGINLFGPYVLLVELSSMLLLSALVVVFHIGSEQKIKKKSLLLISTDKGDNS